MVDLNDTVQSWLEHLRIALLRALADHQGVANESLLTDLANAVFIAATRAQVREQLTWLHNEGLVIARPAAGMLGAELTPRGREVAAGKRVHQGVKQPSPERAAPLALDELLAQLRRKD